MQARNLKGLTFHLLWQLTIFCQFREAEGAYEQFL